MTEREQLAAQLRSVLATTKAWEPRTLAALQRALAYVSAPPPECTRVCAVTGWRLETQPDV